MLNEKLYLEEKVPEKHQQLWQYIKKKHSASTCIWYMVVMFILIIFCNFIAPFSPEYQDFNSISTPPAWDKNGNISHVLGTDKIGRDIYSKNIYGCKITFGYSMIIAIFCLITSLLTSTLIMIADNKHFFIYYFNNIIISIPSMLILALTIVIFNFNETAIYIAATISSYSVLLQKNIEILNNECRKEYVKTAEIEGASRIERIFKVMMPNTWMKILIQAIHAYSVIIIEISSAGFLGLGGENFIYELGFMASQSQINFYGEQVNWIVPTIIIATTLTAINVIAHHIEKFIERSKS